MRSNMAYIFFGIACFFLSGAAISSVGGYTAATPVFMAAAAMQAGLAFLALSSERRG